MYWLYKRLSDKKLISKAVQQSSMPWWHNLVLRKPGNQAKGNQDSLFPKGFPGSNPGHGVIFHVSAL